MELCFLSVYHIAVTKTQLHVYITKASPTKSCICWVCHDLLPWIMKLDLLYTFRKWSSYRKVAVTSVLKCMQTHSGLFPFIEEGFYILHIFSVGVGGSYQHLRINRAQVIKPVVNALNAHLLKCGNRVLSPRSHPTENNKLR